MDRQGNQVELLELEGHIQDLARRDQRWRTWTQIPVVAFALGAPLFVSTVAVLFNLGSISLSGRSEQSTDSDHLASRNIEILVDQVGSIMSFGVAVCMIAAVAIFVMAIRHGAIKGQLRKAEAQHARLISGNFH